jgi:hypothetical protein
LLDVILKRFEHPDELRTLEKGKFEIIQIGGMTLGLDVPAGLEVFTWVGLWARKVVP